MTKTVRAVEYFVLLDMDRTLLDTDQWVDCLYAAFSLSDSEKTVEERRERQRRGAGYDLFRELHERYGRRLPGSHRGGHEMAEVVANRIEALYPAVDLERSLVPDVRELLAKLEHQAVPYAIMTKGGEASQLCKLLVLRAILSRPLPAVIIPDDAPPKAATVLRDWHDDHTGQFLVPPDYTSTDSAVRAHKVAVLDDKPENIAASHPSVYGVLIGRADNMLSGAVSLAQFARTLRTDGLERALERYRANQMVP